MSSLLEIGNEFSRLKISLASLILATTQGSSLSELLIIFQLRQPVVCCPILRSALLCGTEPRNPTDPYNTNGLVPREERPRIGHSGVWFWSGRFCLQSGKNFKQMGCTRGCPSAVLHHFRSRSCSQIPLAFRWHRVDQIRDISWTRTSWTGSPPYLSYVESSTEAFSLWEHFSFCCCRVAIDSQSMLNLFYMKMMKRSQDQQRVGRSVLFHAMIGTLHQWRHGDGGWMCGMNGC